MIATDTIAAMHAFLPRASSDARQRVSDLEGTRIERVLLDVLLPDGVIDRAVAQWEVFRSEDDWAALLASLVEWVDQTRGDIDAPIPIWDDLDDAGESGRFFYFYLFAICYDDSCRYLRDGGCPSDVIVTTMTVMPRHVGVHERKRGSVGFEPGWWLLPILRGEMVHVGSLQFHRVNLGVGNLSPEPWYSEEESLAWGVGFRRGDPSIGLHIPYRAALAPHELDATFDRARAVLGAMWPVEQRRLATCQTWLLDTQLAQFLDPESNVLEFQRRFTLLDGWYDNDEETVGFIFQKAGVPLAELPRDTSLQRGVLGLLERGGHWRARPGWFDFDGIEGR
jgi:hypothetical protein